MDLLGVRKYLRKSWASILLGIEIISTFSGTGTFTPIFGGSVSTRMQSPGSSPFKRERSIWRNSTNAKIRLDVQKKEYILWLPLVIIGRGTHEKMSTIFFKSTSSFKHPFTVSWIHLGQSRGIYLCLSDIISFMMVPRVYMLLLVSTTQSIYNNEYRVVVKINKNYLFFLCCSTELQDGLIVACYSSLGRRKVWYQQKNGIYFEETRIPCRKLRKEQFKSL